jgi:hypothetical protein
MENSTLPAPIFLIAPPAAAAVFAQTLGRAAGVANAGGRVEPAITAQIGIRTGEHSRLTAADATPEIVAAIRAEVAALADGKRLLDDSESNIGRISFLHAVFPEAAFVWVFREPHRAVYDPGDTRPSTPQ